MSVHRIKPLPVVPVRGRLIVAASVAEHTRHLLQQFRGRDGAHEGLVYWAGRRADGDAFVLSALVPNCDHGPQHVMAPPGEIGRLSRAARSMGLVFVAQVHSHPGTDTRHSDGDDKLVLMPHEGLFSLVVADYGAGNILPGKGAGLHQYQDGRWVQIRQGAEDALIIVPTAM